MFLTVLVPDKFIFHERLSNWHEASTTCLEKGGHLAAYNDQTEPSIREILSNYSGSVWIGEYFTPWIWIKGLTNFLSDISYIYPVSKPLDRRDILSNILPDAV